MALVAKPTKKVLYKAFRLIDFRVYDDTAESMETVASSGSESDAGSDSDAGSTRSGEKRVTAAYAQKQFIIQMFGVNEKGETCCIYINDYHPFFYVKVGDHWTQTHAMALRREIVNRVGKHHDESILSVEIAKHHKLYGFSGGKNKPL